MEIKYENNRGEASCLSNNCDKGFSTETLFGEHSRGIINKLRRQTVAEKVNIFAPFVFRVSDFHLINVFMIF